VATFDARLHQSERVYENPRNPHNHEQKAQRNRILSGAQRAWTLEAIEETPEAPAYVLSADELFEPPNQDFGFDL
jgi:hypothetical protein